MGRNLPACFCTSGYSWVHGWPMRHTPCRFGHWTLSGEQRLLAAGPRASFTCISVRWTAHPARLWSLWLGVSATAAAAKALFPASGGVWQSHYALARAPASPGDGLNLNLALAYVRRHPYVGPWVVCRVCSSPSIVILWALCWRLEPSVVRRRWSFAVTDCCGLESQDGARGGPAAYGSTC